MSITAHERVVRTLARCETSSARSAESRVRIGAAAALSAASRARVRWRAGIGGAAGEDLRAELRSALDQGRLPPIAGRAWAGRGSGRPCRVCGTTVHPADVEYEADEVPDAHAHARCFRMWQEESAGRVA